MRLGLSIVAIIATVYFFSCKKVDPVTPCVNKHVTYNNSIKGIIDRNCNNAGCHDVVAPSLKSFTSVKNAYMFQKLMCTVEWGAGCRQMPASGVKLNADTIQILKDWECVGFLEN